MLQNLNDVNYTIQLLQMFAIHSKRNNRSCNSIVNKRDATSITIIIIIPVNDTECCSTDMTMLVGYARKIRPTRKLTLNAE